MPRAAVGVDVHEGVALPLFPSIYRRLRRRTDLGAQLLFLGLTIASCAALQRDASASAGSRGKSAAEELGKSGTRSCRLADRILDASRMSVLTFGAGSSDRRRRENAVRWP